MKRIIHADYEIGQAVSELSQGPITHMDLVRYAGASGDFNPIHTDPGFAKSAGLPGSIAHGMYVMAQLGRLLSKWCPPPQIKKFNVKFKGMLSPGDTVTCLAKVKRKKEEESGEKLLQISLEALVGDEVKITGDATIICD